MIMKLFRCEKFLLLTKLQMGLFIWMFLIPLISCEKDDVCNEGTPGTPRLIIRFYDHENPTTFKGLPGIFVQEVKQENPIYYTEFDSIAIPQTSPFSHALRIYSVLSNRFGNHCRYAGLPCSGSLGHLQSSCLWVFGQLSFGKSTCICR